MLEWLYNNVRQVFLQVCFAHIKMPDKSKQTDAISNSGGAKIKK